MDFRCDVRPSLARLINVLIEDAKSTYGECGVQFHGHPVGAHHVRLGGTEVVRVSTRLQTVRMRVLLMNEARDDPLADQLRDGGALGMEVRLNGNVEFAFGTQLVLVDGHVFDGMYAGCQKFAGQLSNKINIYYVQSSLQIP